MKRSLNEMRVMSMIGLMLKIFLVVLATSCDRVDLNRSDKVLGEELSEAIKSSDVAKLKDLIYSGEDISEVDMNGDMPIHIVCKDVEDRDMIDEVISLTYAKGKINEIGGDKLTPIELAVTRGNKYIIEKLIEYGGNKLVKDSYGNSLIHIAAIFGHVEIIKYLVEIGLSIEAMNSNSESVLTSAYLAKQNSVVEYLLSLEEEKRDEIVEDTIEYYIGEFAYIDKTTHELLKLVCTETNIFTKDVYQVFAEKFKEDHQQMTEPVYKKLSLDGDYTYLLHMLIFNNQISEIISLLEGSGCKKSNTCLFLRDSFGNTPLMLAVHRSNVELVKAILSNSHFNNYLLSIPDINGLTPLDLAILNGSNEIAEILIESSIKPCKASSLFYAILTNNIDIVSGFMDKFEWIDSFGRGIMHFVPLSTIDMFNLIQEKLKEKDLDTWLSKRDNNGTIPFHYLAFNRFIKELKDNSELSEGRILSKIYLEEDIEKYDRNEYTLLKYLVWRSVSSINSVNNQNMNILHYLAYAGDSVSLIAAEITEIEDMEVIVNRKRLTPLDIACKRGSIDTINEIIELYEEIAYSEEERKEKIKEIKKLELLRKIIFESKGLHYAVLSGDIEVCRRLMSNTEVRRALITKVDEEGYLAVELAEKRGEKEILELIKEESRREKEIELEEIVKEKRRERRERVEGYTPLHLIYLIREEKAIEEIVEIYRREINEQNREGDTPLHMCIKEGNKKAAEELLKKGAKEEIRNKEGKIATEYIEGREDQTELMKAIELGYGEEVIKRVIRRMNMEEILGKDREGKTVEDYKEKIDNKKAKDYVERVYDRNRKAERGEEGWIKLMAAAYGGNNEVVETLLAYNANLEASSNKGFTALMIAAQNSHNEVVETLLAHNANLEASSNKGFTALILAAQNGHNKVVETLLSHNANLEASSNKGFTALILAAQNGHNEVVETLLAHSANLEASINSGHTALMIAAQNGNNEVVRTLLAHSANLEASINSGHTALMIAAEKGHNEVVETLLAHNANLEAINKDEFTALMIAAENGHNEVVETLLAHNANLEAINKDKFTVLMIAAQNGHNEVVTILLANNANLEANIDGFTVLMVAAHNSHNDVVKTLLAYNANIEATDNFGWTALMIAAHNGHNEVVETLLAHNANIEATDNFGWTALMIVAQNGHHDIVTMLLAHNANPNAQSLSGVTPLLTAIYNNHLHIFKMLLSISNLELSLQSDWTPLMISALMKNQEMVDLILKHTNDSDNSSDDVIDQAMKKRGGDEVIHILGSSNQSIHQLSTTRLSFNRDIYL